MSTLRVKKVQIGSDIDPLKNFTLRQPASPDGSLILSRGNADNPGETVVSVTAAGNVGINTSTPTSAVGVAKVVMVSGTYSGFRAVGTTGNVGLEMYTGSAAAYIETTSSHSLIFSTAGATRASVTNSGNFTVGTMSDGGGYRMNVVGSSGAAVSRIATLGNGQTYVAFAYNDTTTTGSISTNGSTTSYNTTSDHRLKEDVQPMVGALDSILRLRPVTYRWKIDGSDGEGFIAHELQAECPDAVTGEKDAVDGDDNPVYQGIDTSFLVGRMVAAIQELKAEVDSLREQINGRQV